MKAQQLSAGMIIVRRCDNEPQYLLLRAYNYWDFPKGQVEPREDPLDAARREVREETTLTHLIMRWGPIHRETPIYGRGKAARYYLAEYSGGEVSLMVNPELGRPEHHEFKWLCYDEARGRLVDRLRLILDWAHATVAAQTKNKGR
ncbi:MAG: NUDIX domain-containing protein [Gammaproteobacteria bacterium]|nr:NUDIX domain-containing protein [Gammaproteobacteria bacterium]